MSLHGVFIHYGFSVYFTPLINEFHWSRTELSGVFSLARLENGVVAPLAGMVIDRWGPRRVLMFGMASLLAALVCLGRLATATEWQELIRAPETPGYIRPRCVPVRRVRRARK